MFYYSPKTGFEILDYVRGQGVSRFKSGAYTIVHEHFEPAHNAAIGHQMKFQNRFFIFQ
jgi:hypothetical protein